MDDTKILELAVHFTGCFWKPNTPIDPNRVATQILLNAQGIKKARFLMYTMSKAWDTLSREEIEHILQPGEEK